MGTVGKKKYIVLSFDDCVKIPLYSAAGLYKMFAIIMLLFTVCRHRLQLSLSAILQSGQKNIFYWPGAVSNNSYGVFSVLHSARHFC